MLNKSIIIFSSLVLCLFLSCSDDSDNPATPNDDRTETITDIDGNVYEIVKIGDQWWMAENLKVTHYRNGDAVPNVTDDSEWGDLTTGAYCVYNDESSNNSIYGLLYNWYAIADGRNIAPEGWHVPTDAEWQELEMALGMSLTDADASGSRGTNEGSKLADNSDLWESGSLENDAEFGSSGFAALPGGYCDYTGQFGYLGFRGYYWTLTDVNVATSWLRALDCYESDIDRVQYNKRYGLSVRCVKD